MEISVSESRDFVYTVLNINTDYALDDAIEYIVSHYCPEDVFEKEELEMWAIDNGFVRKDD